MTLIDEWGPLLQLQGRLRAWRLKAWRTFSSYACFSSLKSTVSLNILPELRRLDGALVDMTCGMTCQNPKLLHGGRSGMLGVWALVLWTQANGLSYDLWLVMNSPLFSIIAPWYLNLSMAIDFTLAQVVKSLRIGEALISLSFIGKPVKTNNQTRENFQVQSLQLKLYRKGGLSVLHITWWKLCGNSFAGTWVCCIPEG